MVVLIKLTLITVCCVISYGVEISLSDALSPAAGPQCVFPVVPTPDTLFKVVRANISRTNPSKAGPGYPSGEHLPVQNQQTDPQPPVASSYLVTVTPCLASSLTSLCISTFTHAFSNCTISTSLSLSFLCTANKAFFSSAAPCR